MHLGACLLSRHDEVGFDLSVGRTGIGNETRKGNLAGWLVEREYRGAFSGMGKWRII